MILLVSGMTVWAPANDTLVAINGSPASFGSKTTVRMVSEVVRVYLGSPIRVECDFVFKNEGPACEVKMGFPNGWCNDYDHDRPMKDPPLMRFRSTVDGRSVKVRKSWLPPDKYSIVDRFEIRQWFVKDVTFKRNQTRRVRNTYMVYSGYSGSWGNAEEFTQYVLATGSTWKPKVERSEVIVYADRSSWPRGVEWIPWSVSIRDKVHGPDFWKRHPRAIVYSGPGKVTKTVRSIRFVATHWVPDENVDLILHVRPGR